MTNEEKIAALKDFRERHGVNCSQAEKLLGINYGNWSRYERGIRNIPYSLIKHVQHYNGFQAMLNFYTEKDKNDS